MQQGRWVSYIYRYRDNTRCENAGFIKVQRITYRTNDEARIQIGMKIYKKKPCKCMAYLIYNGDSAKYLTDIYFKAEERDSIMKRVEIPWSNPLSDGMSFEDYDGILFICDDGEILLGMWKEYDVKPGNITPYEKRNMAESAEPAAGRGHQGSAAFGSAAERNKEMTSEVVETIAELEKEKVTEAAETGVEQGMVSEAAGIGSQQSAAVEPQGESAYTIEEKNENSCMEMLRTYPRLPLFADSQFMECVKIVPQDIGKLAMSNWKLGINSFLSHGYYRYRYIMLGKVKFDKKERYVIGVPGVFTNKEKYLANMFGFNVFIPVKRTKLLTGNFGYWISEVLSE